MRTKVIKIIAKNKTWLQKREEKECDDCVGKSTKAKNKQAVQSYLVQEQAGSHACTVQSTSLRPTEAEPNARGKFSSYPKKSHSDPNGTTQICTISGSGSNLSRTEKNFTLPGKGTRIQHNCQALVLPTVSHLPTPGTPTAQHPSRKPARNVVGSFVKKERVDCKAALFMWFLLTCTCA